jgi:tRNA threonylcarbamoyladenosine biosynthesis protein TsaB
LAGATVTGARRHAAEILTAVDQVLRRIDARPADLRGIVVADGPGSFTGLRIGWSAAKGLAQQFETPLRAVPALLAAAAGAGTRVGAGPVIACFDALRGQVFAAVYDVTTNGVTALVPPSLTTFGDLAAGMNVAPRAIVGDAVVQSIAADLWSGIPRLELQALPPGAESLLGVFELPSVSHEITASTEPVYGRLAEAQVRWEAAHGRALPDSPGRGR